MGQFSGGCLCGDVRYECDADPIMAGHCYCHDCRKASGTAHCTHAMVPGSAFKSEGTLSFFAHPADSGNIVRRGFCPQCGSQVYSTNDGAPGMVYVRASSLDDPEAITPQLSVYAAKAPSWDPPPAHLPAFPAMPPMPGPDG